MRFALFNRQQRFRLLKLVPSYTKVPFNLVFLFNLINILLVAVFYFRLQPMIPLFYSLAQPHQQLTHKIWFFLLPGTATFITIFHLILVRIFSDLEPKLIKLFVWTTMILQLILTLIVLRIILIIS